MEDLNRNELEALRILWALGEQKPSVIEVEFSWPIDNGTLRSVLRVLMDKRLVTRRRSGRAYLYRARKSREGVLAGLAKQLAHVFSGGSTSGLIAQLIRTEALAPEELAELRKLAGANKRSTPREKRKDGAV